MTQTVDQVEIEETLARYSYAIDQQDERAFAAVFTSDAVIDFTRTPFPRTVSPAEFWASTVPDPDAPSERLSWQHVVRNPLVIIDGDTALAYSELSGTSLERDRSTGTLRQLEVGGLYEDELARTADGWRISRRTLRSKSREEWQPEVAPQRLDWIAAGRAERDVAWLWADTDVSRQADPAPSADRLTAVEDEAAIRSLLAQYAHGIDQRWWTVFGDAFTADAVIDGTAVGLGEVSPAQLQELLSGDADALRLSGQHLVSNLAVRVEGDRAHSVAEFATHTLRRASTTDPTIIRARQSGTYVDEYARVDGQWRIARHTIRFKANEQATVVYEDAVIQVIDDSRGEVRAAEPLIVPAARSVPAAGQQPSATVVEVASSAVVDHREISQVLVRYSQALDQEWWDLLDDVFTEDAVIHGDVVGLGTISVPEFRALLPDLYATRLSGVHSLGATTVWSTGDRARSSTEFTTISVTDSGAGGADTARRTRSAGTYFDELVHTPDGWRIAHRHVTFKASVGEVLSLDADWQDRILSAAAALREHPVLH